MSPDVLSAVAVGVGERLVVVLHTLVGVQRAQLVATRTEMSVAAAAVSRRVPMVVVIRAAVVKVARATIPTVIRPATPVANHC